MSITSVPASRETTAAGKAAVETAVVEPAPAPTDPSPADPGLLDPRGPQFAAALTAVVLAAALLAPTPYAVALLTVQAGLFAIGAGFGVQATPHAWLFRRLVRPRLAPPTELESPQPPRFAQAVGLAFVAVGLVALLAGATVVGQVAVGFALVAAGLNAVFRFCLGCEVYLLIRRLA